MNDKPTDKKPEQKQKMLTEEEYKKRFVVGLRKAKSARPSYTVKHGFSTHDLCPTLTIVVEGGDHIKHHELSIKIEELLLQYSKDNPPVIEDADALAAHFPSDDEMIGRA